MNLAIKPTGPMFDVMMTIGDDFNNLILAFPSKRRT